MRGVLLEIFELFEIWRDWKSDNSMYRKDLVLDWTSTYLFEQNWYLNYPKDNTPRLKMEIHEKYDLGFIEHLGELEKDTPRRRKFMVARQGAMVRHLIQYQVCKTRKILDKTFINKETTSYLSVLLRMFMLLPFIEFQQFWSRIQDVSKSLLIHSKNIKM